MLKTIYRELQQIVFGFWVPFVSTSPGQIEILLNELDITSESVFLDIGCWDGRVLKATNHRFPWTLCIWHETSPYPYSLATRLQNNKKIEIHNTRVWADSLKKATHIYIYMVPYMTRRVFREIQAVCMPGTRVYIKSHTIPGIIPSKVVPLSEKNDLYIYLI